MGTPQAQVWDGTTGDISGSTPFGLFDNQTSFQNDGPKFATFGARKLGYPTVEVEITSGSFYEAFEWSIMQYSRQVNEFNIRENLINLQGSPATTNFTHNNVAMNTTNLSQIIRLATPYGTEAGSGGNIPLYTGSISVIAGQQDYDLNVLWGAVSASGDTMEIKKIYHNDIPAVTRFFDPYAGTGMASQGMTDAWGFGGMSPAITFTMMPIYADLLRMQEIEMSRDVRWSHYSFQIRPFNKLRLFPIPTSNCTLWFDYILEEDRNDPSGRGYTGSLTSGTGSVADFSNAGFEWMDYDNINTVGKQWIFEYAFAEATQMLGYVRGKYSGIPIPDGEVQLDGDTLRSEAESDKTALIEQLRESLEEAGKRRQMEKSQEESEFLMESLKKIPFKVYIG